MNEKMTNLIYMSGLSDHEAEYIPLLSTDDETSMNNEKLPDALPVLALRNTVLFPGVVIPITIGRDKSINLIKDAYNSKDKTIAVSSQIDDTTEDPDLVDLYSIGTTAHILKFA
jgi:ATP-dependent Lon protease